MSLMPAGHRGRSNRSRRKVDPLTWERVAQPLHVGPDTVGPWAPALIDVGFGTGESLMHAASHHSDLRILGVETYTTGVVRVARWLTEHEHSHVRVSSHDIRELLPCLAPASVDQIRVFFPDPWPKRGHAARRLLTAPFVAALTVVLRPGGVLWIATDWSDYARAIDTVLREQPGLSRVAAPPEPRPATKYEGLAIAAGRECRDFVSVRTETI